MWRKEIDKHPLFVIQVYHRQESRQLKMPMSVRKQVNDEQGISLFVYCPVLIVHCLNRLRIRYLNRRIRPISIVRGCDLWLSENRFMN